MNLYYKMYVWIFNNCIRPFINYDNFVKVKAEEYREINNKYWEKAKMFCKENYDSFYENEKGFGIKGNKEDNEMIAYLANLIKHNTNDQGKLNVIWHRKVKDTDLLPKKVVKMLEKY